MHFVQNKNDISSPKSIEFLKKTVSELSRNKKKKTTHVHAHVLEKLFIQSLEFGEEPMLYSIKD